MTNRQPAAIEGVFAALADQTRLSLLRLLIRERSLCVCEVMAALGVSQTRASRNLGILCAAGLLSRSRAGRWMHYAVRRGTDLEPLLELVRHRVPPPPRARRRSCERRR